MALEFNFLTGEFDQVLDPGDIDLADLGTKNHSDLDQLPWSAAGHTIDDDVDFDGNDLLNGGTLNANVVSVTDDDFTTTKDLITADLTDAFSGFFVGGTNKLVKTVFDLTVGSGGAPTGTGVGIDLDFDLTLDTGAIGTLASLYGIKMAFDLTDNTGGSAIISGVVQPMEAVITTPNNANLTNNMLKFTYTGGGAFSTGMMYVAANIYGPTGAGEVIGLRTEANIYGGTGKTARGYLGYSSARAGSTTPKLTGVYGLAANVGGVASEMIGVLGASEIFVTGTAKDKRVGVSSNGHATVANGSLFLSASGFFPNSLSPDHLDALNNKGELYVEGAAEFDDMLFADGGITMAEGQNIVLGTVTGSQIGTAITQKLGFFGATPIVRPSTYTPSNVTTDRVYDANATTLDEIADVLGTLIADLQSLGLIG